MMSVLDCADQRARRTRSKPMSRRFLSFVGLALVWQCVAAEEPMPAEQRIGEDTQRGLSITIYHDDLALVRDRREVELTPGENRLAWRSVSARIRPETALLSESGAQLAVSLIEQNFDFDLLTADSLLRKYVGRTVHVIRANDAGDRIVEEASVLATNDGVVLRYADRIETQVIGHLAFPDVPPDLRDQPTLVLHLETATGGAGELELAYLTGGLEWQADYVADLTLDASMMDLAGWVTLTNRSGIAYRQAEVQLVAGEVHQVTAPARMPPLVSLARGSEPMALPEQEALFEYHLYHLPRRTDILDQQTKQVALLAAPGVPVTQELVVEGSAFTYRTPVGTGWTRQPVEARLVFDNRDGPLGIPLPKGVVRVYGRDGSGRAQFLGEDRIAHTPKNETVTLKLGESFDVTAQRKQTAFRKLGGTKPSNDHYEAAFALELKNAKTEPVTVKVYESLPGDWRMLDESERHTKEAANRLSWVVEVPGDGSTTLTWRAEVRQ